MSVAVGFIALASIAGDESMVSATFLTLVIILCIFYLWKYNKVILKETV